MALPPIRGGVAQPHGIPNNTRPQVQQQGGAASGPLRAARRHRQPPPLVDTNPDAQPRQRRRLAPVQQPARQHHQSPLLEQSARERVYFNAVPRPMGDLRPVRAPRVQADGGRGGQGERQPRHRPLEERRIDAGRDVPQTRHQHNAQQFQDAQQMRHHHQAPQDAHQRPARAAAAGVRSVGASEVLPQLRPAPAVAASIPTEDPLGQERPQVAQRRQQSPPPSDALPGPRRQQSTESLPGQGGERPQRRQQSPAPTPLERGTSMEHLPPPQRPQPSPAPRPIDRGTGGEGAADGAAHRPSDPTLERRVSGDELRLPHGPSRLYQQQGRPQRNAG
eukprot:Hpha_TRINITY_DN15194_c0_g2::TRINITY_DN15194_c0_g2_i1::g.126726::m.126726